MRDLSKLEFNPLVEDLVQILCNKTQNEDPLFFRLMVSYFLAKIASMMRIHVHTEVYEGAVPVNMYVINLAVSGSGKGRSINIIEEQVIDKFKERFLQETFPAIAKRTMAKLAIRRANRNSSSPSTEEELLENEFQMSGTMVFGFDSGTTAAVKQMRHKLLLAGSGSMNLEIDEIGSNLLGNVEVLNSFLELFDMGKIKQKLTKHTRENVRAEELYGRTPTNMLLFGTPSKLLDGSKTEGEFQDMLETGYARRAYFGYSRHRTSAMSKSPEEIYDLLTDTAAGNHLALLSDRLGQLADPVTFGSTIQVPKDVALELIAYRQHCDVKAETYSDYEEIRKAEMKHRYFKALKLAGVYAFVHQSQYVTEDHLYQAIAMAEMSGEAFGQILKRDRPYVKLASYICTIGREVTHADLVEDLPFYKGNETQKREMMALAIAHGYRNNLLIKKDKIDNIEFFSGESLPETDLNNIIVSYSSDITVGFMPVNGHWHNLWKLCTTTNMHWCSHQFVENPEFSGKGGYRDEAHVIPKFNLAVLDVDSAGINIDTAISLLQEYNLLIHTTKRHEEDTPRFRIIFPLSHILELDQKNYREFMSNIYEWMPFEVDTQTNQRSRKWLTNPGQYWYNDGQLLDVFQFLPKTKKAEERKSLMSKQTNLSALERWFYNAMEEGNRNNLLLRYGFCLVDMGQDLESVKNNVMALNGKLEAPLPDVEVLGTVLQSVNKKIIERENVEP